MTEIDRNKEWTLPDGRRLGYRAHVSPYNGGISWATVDLDTMTVLAIEHYDPYLRTWLAGATCTPHQLVLGTGKCPVVEAAHVICDALRQQE